MLFFGDGLVIGSQGVQDDEPDALLITDTQGVLGKVRGSAPGPYYAKDGEARLDDAGLLNVDPSLRWGGILLLEQGVTVEGELGALGETYQYIQIPFAATDITWGYLPDYRPDSA